MDLDDVGALGGSMLVKSWITTALGVLVVIMTLFHCYEAGKIDLMCIQSVLVGAGLITAKDFNVTGGKR